MEQLEQNVYPLSDFERHTVELVKQTRENKRRLVLTVNGKAEVIVQDADSYQELLNRLAGLEAIVAIRQGLRDLEEGNVRDAREAMKDLQTKLGLSS